MSLKEILKVLGSGEIGSLVNVLQSVVHACIEELEHIRGDNDVQAAQCLETMNRAEDRARDMVGGAVMDLAKRVDGLEGTVRTHVERLEGMLMEVSRRVDGGGTLAGYKGDSKE